MTAAAAAPPPALAYTLLLRVVPDPDAEDNAVYRLERSSASGSGKAQQSVEVLYTVEARDVIALRFFVVAGGLEMVLLDRSGTVATAFSQDSSGGITTTNALAVFMRASSELFRECVIPCAPAQGTETCALRRLYWACWQLPADQRARIASALTAAGFALPSSEPLRLALGGEGEKMDEEEPALPQQRSRSQWRRCWWQRLGHRHLGGASAVAFVRFDIECLI